MPTSCNAGTKLLPRQRRGGSRSNAPPLRAGTLRVLLHAGYTSGDLVFRSETELRYAPGPKARSAQSAMSTRADMRQITEYTLHITAARPFSCTIIKAPP